MMNNYIKIFISASLLSMSFSCKKLVKVDVPKTELTAIQAFSNDQSAVAVISNIYGQFNTVIDGNITPRLGLYTDELLTTSSDINNLEYYNGFISVTNSGNLNLWRALYSVIYQSNALLENIEIAKQISTGVRNQLKGEAFFLRALAYFYLINIYGDIPLLTTTEVSVTSVSTRSSVSKIYTQIISDLISAKDLLSEFYPSENRVRANKWAAVALLARVYLFLGNWQMAESESTDLISSGIYGPFESLDNVFSKNSRETILQFWTRDGFTVEGTLFIPQNNSIASYPITDNLLDSFETGDERKIYWIDSTIVNTNVYYYPHKYKNRSHFTGDEEEYLSILRLSEQYLIRAEARAEQSNIQGGIADLNLIRKRAGLPDAIANDKQALLSLIKHERQIELFCEWGHRFFDLKRYGYINQLMSSLKTGWKLGSDLLPIPQYERLNNPNLTQNPGY